MFTPQDGNSREIAYVINNLRGQHYVRWTKFDSWCQIRISRTHLSHVTSIWLSIQTHKRNLLCSGSKLSVGAFIEQFNVSIKYSSPPNNSLKLFSSQNCSCLMHTFILCITAWLNIIYTIIGTFIDIDFDAKNASRSGKLLESCCGSIRAFFVAPLSMTATWNIYTKCTHILGYNRIYHDISCRWLRVGKHSYVVIPSEASGCFLRKPQIRNIMKILSGLLEHKFIKDRKCVAFFNTIFLPFLSKQSWRIKMFHCSENIYEMTEDFTKKWE